MKNKILSKFYNCKKSKCISNNILDKTLATQSGQALIQALISTIIVGAALYYTSFLVNTYQHQVQNLDHYLELKQSIQSTTDFVIFGIKQKYCFDATLMRDPSCTLNNTSSVERLIMSQEQEGYIKELLAIPTSNLATQLTAETKANLRLNSIEKSVSFTSITELHPLYLITKSPTLREVAQGVYVKIERDDSPYLPRYGGEAYLKLTVDMIGLDNSRPMVVGGRKLRLVSTISIHPREVGSFALLVPHDLRLDVPNGTTLPQGDVLIHRFTGADAATVKTKKGLIFQSPVFVNKDIHLPTNSSYYTPVTFADKVFIGNGLVYKNGAPYTPASVGGINDRYWSDQGTFGGFLRGIETDGVMDKGLLVFGNLINPNLVSSSDVNKMILCLNRTQHTINKTSLLSTSISARLKYSDDVSTADSRGRYRLQLDNNGDEFTLQYTPERHDLLEDSRSPDWDSEGGNFQRVTTSPSNSATAMITARLNFFDGVNDHWLTSDLGIQTNDSAENHDDSITDNKDTEYVLITTPKSGINEYIATLNSNMSLLNSNITVKEAFKAPLDSAKATKIADRDALIVQKNTLNTEITTLTNEIQTLTTEIAALNPATDAALITTKQNEKTAKETLKSDKITQVNNINNQISTLNTEIASLTSQITPVEAELTTLYSDKTTLQAKIDSLIDKRDNHPAKIKMYLSRYYKYGRLQKDRLNFHYEILNKESMLDNEGKYYVFNIQVQAYNNAYNAKGMSVQIDNGFGSFIYGDNPNLIGFFNFGRNQINGNLILPEGLVTESNNTGSAGTDADIDWAQVDLDCQNNRNAQTSQSFGYTDGTTDFSDMTRHSWNFTPVGTYNSDPGRIGNFIKPLIPEIIFNNLNATPDTTSFQIRSIVGTCRIQSTATLVTGLFACDNLVIEARSTPLKIIASIIAGKLSIDPSALNAGITWSSIYHPQATEILRNIGILHPLTGKSGTFATAPTCTTTSVSNDTPIWHPLPSIRKYSNRESCNVSTLRAKAAPFRWTSVDPDCGLIAGKTATTCKHSLVNFFVFEHSREGDL